MSKRALKKSQKLIRRITITLQLDTCLFIYIDKNLGSRGFSA